MITTTIICEAGEMNLSVSSDCLKHLREGDTLKLAFELIDGLPFERLQEYAKLNPRTVSLYRNSIWLNFIVLNREFFMLAYTDNIRPESCAIYVRPKSPAVMDCLEIIQRVKPSV